MQQQPTLNLNRPAEDDERTLEVLCPRDGTLISGELFRSLVQKLLDAQRAGYRVELR